MHHTPERSISNEVANNANIVASQISSSYSVIRRNGDQTPFDRQKIVLAMTKAFLAVEGEHAKNSNRIHDIVEQLVNQVVPALERNLPSSGVMHIEDIQDQVELALMRAGEHKVARSYVLYRAEQAEKRQREEALIEDPKVSTPLIIMHDGERKPLDEQALEQSLLEATQGITDIDTDKLLTHALNSAYDGISINDFNEMLVLNARSLIDQDPNYSQVTARLLLQNCRDEAMSFVYDKAMSVGQNSMNESYPSYFKRYIKMASELELLDEELTRFDLEKLGKALLPERDLNFTYLGLQTLYDRYFIHSGKVRFELGD